MREESIFAHQHLSKISISSNPNNEPVSVHGQSEHLRCVGIGTDAAVFQSIENPAYAFKLFAEDKVEKVSN